MMGLHQGGPAPHQEQHSREQVLHLTWAELTLLAGVQTDWPRRCESRKAGPPLPCLPCADEGKGKMLSLD